MGAAGGSKCAARRAPKSAVVTPHSGSHVQERRPATAVNALAAAWEEKQAAEAAEAELWDEASGSSAGTAQLSGTRAHGLAGGECAVLP